jgi:hypothetical protein
MAFKYKTKWNEITVLQANFKEISKKTKMKLSPMKKEKEKVT